MPIDIALDIEPDSGSDVALKAFVALNGTPITNSGVITSASNNKPAHVSIPWQLTLSDGDFIEVFVSNEDNTNNVTVTNAVLRIN